jgi:hypothetical protein
MTDFITSPVFDERRTVRLFDNRQVTITVVQRGGDRTAGANVFQYANRLLIETVNALNILFNRWDQQAGYHAESTRTRGGITLQATCTIQGDQANTPELGMAHEPGGEADDEYQRYMQIVDSFVMAVLMADSLDSSEDGGCSGVHDVRVFRLG